MTCGRSSASIAIGTSLPLPPKVLKLQPPASAWWKQVLLSVAGIRPRLSTAIETVCETELRPVVSLTQAEPPAQMPSRTLELAYTRERVPAAGEGERSSRDASVGGAAAPTTLPRGGMKK